MRKYDRMYYVSICFILQHLHQCRKIRISYQNNHASYDY